MPMENLGVLLGANYSAIQELGYYKIVENTYTFGESIGVGLNRFTSQMSSYWRQLKLIFLTEYGRIQRGWWI